MVNQLSKENYIPSSDEAHRNYAVAVLREYRKFFDKKGQTKKEKDNVNRVK